MEKIISYLKVALAVVEHYFIFPQKWGGLGYFCIKCISNVHLQTRTLHLIPSWYLDITSSHRLFAPICIKEIVSVSIISSKAEKYHQECPLSSQNRRRKSLQRNNWLSLITSDLKQQPRAVDSTKMDGFIRINYSRTY